MADTDILSAQHASPQSDWLLGGMPHRGLTETL